MPSYYCKPFKENKSILGKVLSVLGIIALNVNLKHCFYHFLIYQNKC